MKDPREVRIDGIVKNIASIQKHHITPLEKEAYRLLKKLFPKLPKQQLEDWLMEVLYNDPKNALKRMHGMFDDHYVSED